MIFRVDVRVKPPNVALLFIETTLKLTHSTNSIQFDGGKWPYTVQLYACRARRRAHSQRTWTQWNDICRVINLSETLVCSFSANDGVLYEYNGIEYLSQKSILCDCQISDGRRTLSLPWVHCLWRESHNNECENYNPSVDMIPSKCEMEHSIQSNSSFLFTNKQNSISFHNTLIQFIIPYSDQHFSSATSRLAPPPLLPLTTQHHRRIGPYAEQPMKQKCRHRCCLAISQHSKNSTSPPKVWARIRWCRQRSRSTSMTPMRTTCAIHWPNHTDRPMRGGRPPAPRPSRLPRPRPPWPTRPNSKSAHAARTDTTSTWTSYGIARSWPKTASNRPTSNWNGETSDANANRSRLCLASTINGCSTWANSRRW